MTYISNKKRSYQRKIYWYHCSPIWTRYSTLS